MIRIPSFVLLQQNPIKACVVSPDKRLIITACSGAVNSSIIVWSAASGDALCTLDDAHLQGSLALAVSPDSRLLASLSTPFPVPLHHPDAIAGGAAGSSPVMAAQEVSIWQMPSELCWAGGADEVPPPVGLQLLTCVLIPVTDPQHSIAFNGVGALGQSRAASSGTTGIGDSPLLLLHELVSTGVGSAVFWSLFAGALEEEADEAKTSDPSLLLQPNSWQWQAIHSVAPVPGCASPIQHPEWALAAAGEASASNRRRLLGLAGTEVQSHGYSAGAASSARGGPSSQRQPPAGILVSSAGLGSSASRWGAATSAGQSGFPLGDAGLRPATGSGGSSGAAVALYSQLARQGVPSLGLGAGGIFKGVTWAGDRRRCTATAFLPFRTVSGSSTCVSALTVTTDGLAVMWASGLDSADEEEVARAAGGGLPAAAEAEAAAAAVGAGTVASHFPVVLLMPKDAEAACATAVQAEGGEHAGSRGGRGPSFAAQPPPLSLPDRLAAVRRLAGQLCMRGAAKTVRLAKSVEGAGAREGVGEGEADSLLSASGPSLGGPGTGSVLPPASSLNALLLAPGGGHILVGGEDGCLRCYDTQLRLVAWWEELEAGGIVCMDFFPQGYPAPAATHSLGGSGGAVEDPPPAGAAALPPLLMETRRSLLLRLVPASFEGGSPEDRRGSVLLEGPDAAVAGVAAYPAPFAHLLAVAVASGCVQLWDTGADASSGGAASTSSHPQLLAVRELIRPHGFAAGSAAAAAAALAAPQLFHPTCLALDPMCRFLGVGTAEGFVCLLDPLTLSDTQPALQPGSFHSAAASTAEAGGGFGSGTSSSSASLAAAVGAGPSLLGRSAAPLTHVAFAADGLHLAASDSERHVLLWRFVRRRTRQISGRATSRLGLGRSGSVLGNRRRHGGSTAPGAGSTAHRPRAWELVAGDAAGMEEGVEDRWTYLGRAKTHGAAVTGLSFSHLSPGTAVSPHAAPLIAPASAPGNTELALAAAGGGGCEGGEGAFWDPAGELVHGGASRPGSEQAGDPSQILPRSLQAGVLGQHAAAGLSMLASVGADRRVVLYDVGASGVTSGLRVAAHGGARHAIAQFATPTSCLWYPPTSPPLDSEPDAAAAAECLLVASSDVKLRAWRFTPHPAAAAAAASHGLSAAASMFPGAVASSAASLALTQQAPACTKTVLAPSTLGSITHMVPVASGPASDTGLLAFATDDRVVGIAALPLSGSPLSAVAVLAHPGPVTGLAVSHTGFRLFSCGREAPVAAGDNIAQRGKGVAALQEAAGGSGSVCIWSLQPSALLSQLGGAAASASARSSLGGEGEAATVSGASASGEGMAPFLELLEAGASSSAAQAHASPGPAPGLFYQQVCDVFAYAQIRSQGEDSTARRAVGISLPLGEVPAVMRALGFYPTSHDMAAMHCEAVGAAYTAAYRRALGVGRAAAILGAQLPPGTAAGATAAGVAAALRAEVDLPSLVRLLVNHRPFVPVGREQLLRALRIIGNYVESTEGGAGASGRGGGFFAHSAPSAPSAIRALRAEAGDRNDDGFTIRWGALTRLLGVRGERILGSELATCLTALLGPPEREGGSGDEGEGGDSHFDDEDELTPAALVGRVLGFAE